MNQTSVSFLYLDGCPLAPRARDNLRQAIENLAGRQPVALEEVELLVPGTPHKYKRWGSPTILVDGRDVTGAEPGNAVNCRTYPPPGVPSVAVIMQAIASQEPGSEPGP